MAHRFKLIAGMHAQGGAVYRKGDIIESDQNLCQVLVNKFEDLGPVAKERVEQETVVSPKSRKPKVRFDDDE
jgi:hypothetical protein